MSSARPARAFAAKDGVGDLATHHADEVAVALGQRPLRLQWVLEPPDTDHRQRHRLAQRGRDEQRVAGRYLHRRLDHVQAGGRHPDRRVEVVDEPLGLDHLGHRDGVRRSWCRPRSARPRTAARRVPATARSPPGPRRRSPAAAGPGSRAPRRIRRCGCWRRGRGSRARSSCASTAARSRRTRPPGSATATCAYPDTISAISDAATSCGTSRNSGSAMGDGAHAGRREYIPDPCPPLWLIWAKIGVP